jgi:hypothetical protein
MINTTQESPDLSLAKLIARKDTGDRVLFAPKLAGRASPGEHHAQPETPAHLAQPPLRISGISLLVQEAN